MASITLEALEKRFGGTAVLRNVNLRIADGSYTCVLGPSGCGKTTLLRLLAGFDLPSAGVVRFDDQVVSAPSQAVPPEGRHVGVVFQSYALWPHMTVWENVEYPLRMRQVSAAERKEQTERMLEAVGLEGLAGRRPAELSGGQKQRVALARALVARPAVLLLDEPLSALDQHLREQMRVELKALHRQTGTTVVHVTHDQEEALSLADQIVVMRQGRVEQAGTPEQVWDQPATPFAASFVGRPALLRVRVLSTGGGQALVALPTGRTVSVRANPRVDAAQGTVVVRPEGLILATRERPAHFEGVVRDTLYRGGGLEAVVEGDGYSVRATLPRWAACARGERLALHINDAWLIPDEEI